jgi:hypothetical protein
VLRTISLCLLYAISACEDSKRDTCSGGDNMSNPRISEGVELTAQSPELHLTWERGTGVGASLPDSYFDSVRRSESGVNLEVIQSVEHIAAREILIRLAREGLIRRLEEGRALNLTLEFPDRRSAIACTHPGTADVYVVNITLEVHGGVLSRATVEQSAHLGGY